VLARNEVLASHAERAICQATASVYTKVLMNIEEKVVSLPMPTSESREDDVEEFVEAKVSTQEVLALLGSTAGLADSLAPADANLHDHDRTLPPKERKKSGYKVDEEQSDENMSNAESSDMETAEQDMNGDAPRANGVSAEWNGSSASHYHQNSRNIEDVRQHLLLLAEHPLHFLVHHPRTATTAESWSVPFGSLTTRLRLAAVMDTIASRYPSAALRLANLLHEKGKLDEKALSFQSLLNQKIMRSCLASMHSDGLLELQEVPRDNNRMPAKTIFLWFFDPRRAAARLLNETYKAMSRLLQRVSVERESFRGVLDKASRSDVVGREEELLTKGELSSLKTWKAKESRLFGELERLDDLVLLLQNE
jgi:DNA-directed RNA polymerase III subunit RPC3